MKFQSTLAAAASLAASASAQIAGFEVPAEFASNSTINVNLFTGGNIQSEVLVAVSFGITPTEKAFLGSFGTYLNSSDLINVNITSLPGTYNGYSNITRAVTIPDTVPQGESIFQASVYRIIGASKTPTITTYYANVTIGECFSQENATSALIPSPPKKC